MTRLSATISAVSVQKWMLVYGQVVNYNIVEYYNDTKLRLNGRIYIIADKFVPPCRSVIDLLNVKHLPDAKCWE